MPKCKKVTDAGVVAIAAGCRELTSLDLAHIPGITDASLIALSQHCMRLHTINVHDCEGVRIPSKREHHSVPATSVTHCHD